MSRWSLKQVARVGYLLPEVMVVDGTHIKANANLEKHMKKAIPGMAKRYQEQLDEKNDAGRANHSKESTEEG